MDLLECTVRVAYNGKHGNLEVVKTGPDAVTPAEAFILIAKHSVMDEDAGMTSMALSNVRVIGRTSINTHSLMASLVQKYGRDLVKQVFPTVRQMPRTLADLDLPPECMAPKKVKKAKAEEKPEVILFEAEETEIERLRGLILDAEKELPEGDLTEEELLLLCEEYDLDVAA